MTVKIQILHVSGCPSYFPTRTLVREIAAELQVDAEFEDIEIRTHAEARRMRFLGSPTVRVDGRDIDPGVAARMDYGFSCRMYGRSGIPPRALVETALSERPPV